MRKLRVLVMMDELLIPPASIEGLSENEVARFQTEYDVLTTLQSMGHEAQSCGVKTDLGVIAPAIQTFQPHVCAWFR